MGQRDTQRVLAISPHCDDAVFACGDWLRRHPGAIVVTVFAGSPPHGFPMPEWDRTAGFQPGDDVMALRRAEDRAALSWLKAVPRWLDFCDSQYQQTPSVAAVAEALAAVIEETKPSTVACPLGLFHSDHLLTHDAGVSVWAQRRELAWMLYEDALYRRIPGLVEQRVAVCETRGWRLAAEPELSTKASAWKRAAVRCYQSQLRALASPNRPGHVDAFAPERLWRVTVANGREVLCREVLGER